MPFIQTLTERIGPGRPYFVAYDKVVYGLIREQILRRGNNFRSEQQGIGGNRKGRLERLEGLADALYKHLEYNEDSTIGFSVRELPQKNGRKFLKAEIQILIAGISIEEPIGRGTVIHHFRVEYQKRKQGEYGYLIPKY